MCLQFWERLEGMNLVVCMLGAGVNVSVNLGRVDYIIANKERQYCFFPEIEFFKVMGL